MRLTSAREAAAIAVAALLIAGTDALAAPLSVETEAVEPLDSPMAETTAATGQPFRNPPEVASENGVLAPTLTVGPAIVNVAGEDVLFPALYDRLYTPPLLRTSPGDQVKLRLNNFAQLPTNMHYHGFNVTPRGRGDNIFLSINSGDSFRYNFPIPANHRQGLYWYHPHRDPLLNTQIAGGMAGGIIIGDVLAPFPSLRNIPERILLLKDLKTENGMPVVDPDPSGPTTRTINGLYKPTLRMRPGRLEFWRIGNQSSNIFYSLHMNDQTFYVIASDGNLQNRPTATKTLLLPPGSRREVLIYGPPAGTYRLFDDPFNTGPAGDQYPGQLMMTVISEDAPVTPIPIPPASAFPKLPDLRKGPIARNRTIVFSDTVLPDLFYINGKPYTPDCVDTVVEVGDVERWTIKNTAQEAHVFHIHQLDFQVVNINGEPQPFDGYNDVVTLPPAPSDTEPSVVTVLIPFTNPVIVGKFVYHCHIIQHEDQGMMSVVQVIDPSKPRPPIRMCQTNP
jgi:FtsP/CotA-like multicopper oxidase with cupredoxin domain